VFIVIPFGLLYVRPLQWWLRTRGFSLRENPLHTVKITRHFPCALCIWRKLWFLSHRQHVGGLLFLSFRKIRNLRAVYITGGQNIRVDTLSFTARSGSVHVSAYDALSTLVLSHSTSPLGAGCCGEDMAEATPVHIFPCSSAPRS